MRVTKRIQLMQRRPKEADLKSCPFCGSYDISFQSIFGAVPNGEAYRCECNSCLAKSHYKGTKKAAALIWNKRS